MAYVCLFGSLYRNAIVINSTSLFCMSPGTMSLHSAKVNFNILPKDGKTGSRNMKNANNERFTVTPHFSFTYYPDNAIERIIPVIPTIGGTHLNIVGSNFVASSNLMCRFNGHLNVPATYIRSSLIRCLAPRMEDDEAIVEVSNNAHDFSSNDII